MKIRNPKSEIRIVLALLATCLAAGPVWAATNSETPSGTLDLNPPHAEIPPSFLERYGWWLLLAGLCVLAVTVLAVWWVRRPRPPVIVPIEIQARRELHALSGRVQDGHTLSQVSRSLRRYLAAAFELPPEEMTTLEFCRAAGASQKLGPELAARVGPFLKLCDELKFALSDKPPPIGVAFRALELVELGEARRAQLQQPAPAPTAQLRAAAPAKSP